MYKISWKIYECLSLRTKSMCNTFMNVIQRFFLGGHGAGPNPYRHTPIGIFSKKLKVRKNPHIPIGIFFRKNSKPPVQGPYPYGIFSQKLKLPSTGATHRETFEPILFLNLFQRHQAFRAVFKSIWACRSVPSNWTTTKPILTFSLTVSPKQMIRKTQQVI